MASNCRVLTCNLSAFPLIVLPCRTVVPKKQNVEFELEALQEDPLNARRLGSLSCDFVHEQDRLWVVRKSKAGYR